MELAFSSGSLYTAKEEERLLIGSFFHFFAVNIIMKYLVQGVS